MGKVLVVDDEIYIRKGIINAIQWEFLGLELVGEAEDGAEAFDMSKALEPDIVIMDMMMPGMDGIALINKLKNNCPQIKIIVISAYSNFEYTREAIINKAFDYILKPVKKDELNSILSKCIMELEREEEEHPKEVNQRNEARVLENIVEKLIFDVSVDDDSTNEDFSLVNQMLDFPNVYCCVCKVDNISYARSLGNVIDTLVLIKSDIEECFKEVVNKQAIFINKSSNEVVCVFSCKNNGILSLLEEVGKSINERRKFTISIGLGANIKNSLELNNSYKQAVRALKMKKLSSVGVIISHEEIENDKKMEPIQLNYNRNLLLNSIKTGDFEKSMEFFNKLLNEFSSKNITINAFQKAMIILFGDIEKELGSLNTSIDYECGKSSIAYVHEIINAFNREEMEEIFSPVINKLCFFYNIKRRKGGKKIIDEIIKSMNIDYFKQISLADYSKQYFLNADYLGRIFKSEIGKSFIDYLTGIRIDKAKELIEKDLCSHYYEVASSVGYEDYSYFCKVFKMTTGQAPGEYKDNCSQSRK